MNMDEFIASIWNTDEIQVNPPPPLYDEAEKNKSVAPESTIPEPNSSSDPPPNCNKTTDEVWSQIQKSQPQSSEPENNTTTTLARSETLQNESTFGEMTLEDFLVKAGVVTEQTLFTTILPQNHFPTIPTHVPFNTSYILIGTAGSNVNVPCARFEPHQMLPQNNHFVVRNLPPPNVAVENPQNIAESSSGKGKKRISHGPPEVVIERRQRRMLKNRESAARSRARRQAYTVELEAELGNLKTENESLKNMLAEDEKKRKKILIEISKEKPSTMAQKRNEKLKKLKRPLSASW